MMRQIKTPMMMRTASHERRSEPRPLGEADPAKRPPLAYDRPPADEARAAADWLAHVKAGWIEVK